MTPRLNSREQLRDALLERCLFLRRLERWNVFADGQNYQVGLEVDRFPQLASDVVAGVRSFEIGDVFHHRLWRDSALRRESLGHQMNVVLRLRAGRHAPVSRPADIRLRSVLRDAVAEEKNLAKGILSGGWLCSEN